MKFEVINSKGRCMQSTTYPECVPYDMLESMANHNYKFRVDGKIVSRYRVKAAVNASLGIATDDSAKLDVVSVDMAKTADATGNADMVTRVGASSVICVEDDITFTSQSEAAKHYGISAMSVSKAVKTGKPVKGHTFKRI